ncbi:DUF47 domain-containing protein [Kineococcus glutinatus]|uniref:DUF47 family protein n=1 Tax=Kineococcus glutinatus TaxID=1070872 RepID=A0ABP9HQZ9_9ACTN
MRLRLTPRDDSFYELFAAIGRILVDAATVLAQFLGSGQHERAELAERMQELEHAGDDATHAVLRRVNSSFVTPFDREDIYTLASRLDDCLDEMHAAVDLVVIYRVGDLLPGLSDVVQVLVRQAELTAAAMPRLRSPQGLTDYWVEVSRLENQADAVRRRLLGRLFDGSYATLEIMKHKEVVEALDRAADAFEHVAQTVETMALKES